MELSDRTLWDMANELPSGYGAMYCLYRARILNEHNVLMFNGNPPAAVLVKLAAKYAELYQKSQNGPKKSGTADDRPGDAEHGGGTA